MEASYHIAWVMIALEMVGQLTLFIPLALVASHRNSRSNWQQSSNEDEYISWHSNHNIPLLSQFK